MARCNNYNEKVLGDFDFTDFDPKSVKKFIKLVDKDFIKRIREKHPKTKFKISEINNIISAFHDNVSQAIVDNRDGVKLPLGLGHIMLTGCPKSKRKKYLDFKKTRELGYKVYRKNPDTDELYPTVKYSMRTLKSARMRNTGLWAFVKCHKLRDLVNRCFPENPYKYYNLGRNETLGNYITNLAKTLKK